MENVDLSRWEDIISSYSYEYSQDIFDRIRSKGFFATTEDYDIVNSIVLWKLNRRVFIDSEMIECLNAIGKTVKKPEDALTDLNVPVFIEETIASKGIRLPISSTILHFYVPYAFPIIDQRAYRQAYNRKLSSNAGWKEYSQYISKCIDLCRMYNIPFDMIDKVLYQYDKNLGYNIE